MAPLFPLRGHSYPSPRLHSPHPATISASELSLADGRDRPLRRLDPGMMPLPDTAAGLEWSSLVNAAKAYEGRHPAPDPAPLCSRGITGGPRSFEGGMRSGSRIGVSRGHCLPYYSLTVFISLISICLQIRDVSVPTACVQHVKHGMSPQQVAPYFIITGQNCSNPNCD